jgi:hypothetical protein
MIKQIFLFGISFISIFILSEIFIRTSHLASVSSTEFYDDIGRGSRKSLNFLYFNEGFGVGKFNEYRYIGGSNPPQRNQNTIRIALIGDSYVESFQIFERDYFGEIAENYLENIYQTKQFEFLNFGRSGFDIADIYAYQKTLLEKFNPDFILYMVSNGDLEPHYSDPLRPRTIIENDSLIISFNFNPQEIEVFEETKFLTQNSSIFHMLNNGRKKTKTTPFFAILLDKIYFWFNPESESTIFHSEHQKAEYQINSVTKKIIESLDTNKIIIVNRDLEELPWEFQELCSNNGLKYFDLSKKLNSMKEQGIDPNEWKVTKKRGHWNQKAHQTVGKEIAIKICEIIENE